jgi:hypothetical protein
MSVNSSDKVAIPTEALLWHDGLLLAPLHFQTLTRRQEELVTYHVRSASPYAWGVRTLTLPADGLTETGLSLGRTGKERLRREGKHRQHHIAWRRCAGRAYVAGENGRWGDEGGWHAGEAEWHAEPHRGAGLRGALYRACGRAQALRYRDGRHGWAWRQWRLWQCRYGGPQFGLQGSRRHGARRSRLWPVDRWQYRHAASPACLVQHGGGGRLENAFRNTHGLAPHSICRFVVPGGCRGGVRQALFSSSEKTRVC